jgi:hypothetical protein
MGRRSLSQRDRARVMKEKAAAAIRLVLAGLLSGWLIWYTTGVVSGDIPKQRQIDAVHLALIAVGAVAILLLVHPTALQRLRTVELSGFKLEMLEHIRERQIRQEDQLQDVRLLVPLLFPDAERRHLSNLARGATQGYKGGGSLRDELRRLRSIGLIEMKNNHAVGELRSDMTVDLSEYVQLTDLGKRWVQRLAALDAIAVEGPD